MAELGIVASALQIADIGIRLSLRLYTFGETVAGADKSIISISKDVSLTSTVLKELGQTLGRDQAARICSPNAVQTAEIIANECQRIFQDMDHVLVKKFANTVSAEKDRRIKAAQTLERLRWPFIKGKIELLTSNLERQKSTLVLMLNVIALAKQEYERTEPSTIIAEQRSIIQDLARSNEEYTRRFEHLKRSYEDVPIHREPILTDCNNTIPTPKVPTARGWASASAVGAARQRESSTGAQGLGPEPYMGSWYFHGSDTSLPDQLSWLQQQYRNLMSTLLIEVSAPNYEIADDSRSRIKAEIVTIHMREIRYMEQIQYSRSASLEKPMAWPIPVTQAQHQTHSCQSDVVYSESKTNRDHIGMPVLHQPMFQQQQSATSQSDVVYSESKTNRDHIGMPVLHRPMFQEATYEHNFPFTLRMSASSHSTRGEHEQNSAAQSRPSMPSMMGILPPPDLLPHCSFPRPSPVLPVASGTSSFSVYPRATSEQSGQRTSFSKPPPGITIASPSDASQSRSPLQCYALPSFAKAVDQESSMYGRSAGQSDQRQPKSQILDPQAPSTKIRKLRTRKRKVDSASFSPELPVRDTLPPTANRPSRLHTSKFARRHEEQNAVTEDTLTSEGGASDETHMASSRQDFEDTIALEDNAVYSRDKSSRNVHRERSLERISQNDTPKGGAENVVDKLLATWTTLPVSANRTASHQGGFAVVAH